MSVIFFLILILNQVNNSSSIIQRHIRLLTNNEQYHIQCPYNLNYLNLQLLNYSNEYCFNLYSISNNNNCKNHYTPCQFYAKPVLLHCHYHSYSNYVDITYQCSYKSTTSSFTLQTLSFPTKFSNPEETIALFLIIFSIIIMFWIFISCIWFIRHQHHNENSQLLSHQSDPKNNPLIIDNLRLHVNPFENNHIPSLTTTQIV